MCACSSLLVSCVVSPYTVADTVFIKTVSAYDESIAPIYMYMYACLQNVWNPPLCPNAPEDCQVVWHVDFIFLAFFLSPQNSITMLAYIRVSAI